MRFSGWDHQRSLSPSSGSKLRKVEHFCLSRQLYMSSFSSLLFSSILGWKTLGGKGLLFHLKRKAEQTMTQCLTIFPKPMMYIIAFNTQKERNFGILLMSVVQMGRPTEAKETGLPQLPNNQGVCLPTRGCCAHPTQMCTTG